jgi:hypothetical protein
VTLRWKSLPPSGAGTRFVETEHGRLAGEKPEGLDFELDEKDGQGILAALALATNAHAGERWVLLVWSPGHPVVNRARAGGAE